MPQTPAARRYAKALLDLAKEQKAEEQVGQELSHIAAALADPAVAQVMTQQTLSAKAQKETRRSTRHLALAPPARCQFPARAGGK